MYSKSANIFFLYVINIWELVMQCLASSKGPGENKVPDRTPYCFVPMHYA